MKLVPAPEQLRAVVPKHAQERQFAAQHAAAHDQVGSAAVGVFVQWHDRRTPPGERWVQRKALAFAGNDNAGVQQLLVRKPFAKAGEDLV
jgi:hypothetical protein